MFISPAMMIILFKTATLMILIAIVVYTYIHYIRPMLQRVLEDTHNAYAYMVKTNNALDQQQQEIAKHARLAHESAQILKQKIASWKVSVHKDQEQRISDIQQLRTQFAKIRYKRQDNSVHEQMRMRLILQALHMAEQELTHQYHQSHAAQPYIDTLVQSLRNEQ